jgi:cell division protein FtsL
MGVIMRWSNMIFVVMTLATCFALYQMKYDNRDLRKKVTEIEDKISEEEDAIKILRAEWSLLAQPSRIEKLAQKFLDLEQLDPKQIWHEKNLANLPKQKGINQQDARKLNHLIERSLITSSIKKDAE